MGDQEAYNMVMDEDDEKQSKKDKELEDKKFRDDILADATGRRESRY